MVVIAPHSPSLEVLFPGVPSSAHSPVSVVGASSYAFGGAGAPEVTSSVVPVDMSGVVLSVVVSSSHCSTHAASLSSAVRTPSSTNEG